MSRLREARDLIADPKDWVRGAYAADESGHPVAIDEEVSRHCGMGALMAAWELPGNMNFGHCAAYGRDRIALSAAAQALFPQPEDGTAPLNPIVYVNDLLGHEAIIQVYEKAIVEEYGSL